MQNAHHTKDWGDRIEAGQLATVRGVAFTPEDVLRSDIIERLMCDLKADVPAAIRRHGFDPHCLDDVMASLEKLVADGGTLDQLVALGTTLESLQPRLGDLAALVPDLSRSAEALGRAVGPLGELAGRIPLNRRRPPLSGQ